MARSTVAAFVIALLAAIGLLAQTSAGAETINDAGWHVDPTEGPAETLVSVFADTPCPNPGDIAIVRMLDGKTEVTKAFINSDESGHWESVFTVPEDTAPGSYTLTAGCAA